MFEEAWTFAVSARPQPSTELAPGRVWHRLADCPLYFWGCPGSVRDRGRLLFLYVEYRSATGAARYTRMQFRDEAAARIFIQSHLPYWPLNDLDGPQTAARPPGPEAMEPTSANAA
jgi:hypothetical protein